MKQIKLILLGMVQQGQKALPFVFFPQFPNERHVGARIIVSLLETQVSSCTVNPSTMLTNLYSVDSGKSNGHWPGIGFMLGAN
jgi:hypothetical protein